MRDDRLANKKLKTRSKKILLFEINVSGIIRILSLQENFHNRGIVVNHLKTHQIDEEPIEIAKTTTGTSSQTIKEKNEGEFSNIFREY